ncbi:serine/threonine-protein kinase [Citricoccus sp. GCM10030269]|uniref:serine/threonine-protein kinase n=1 Tax=Citricoccus sp. GCM10030269 TaxID=3273388 RepID=UPI0036079016
MDTAETVPQVPGWSVVRELGRGASSTVWLVATADGAEAALKIPHHEVDSPTELLDVELKALGELTHDHVVRPLGVVATDRGPGLLSDYHAGGSLGSLLQAAGPLPLGQVVTVLVPLAQALQALHEHGVVHGDLSPGNILFTVQGRPAVSDLGSSRLLGGPGQRTGTPGFAAPELDGRSPAADVFGDSGGASAGPEVLGRPGEAERPVDGLQPAADLYSLAAVAWFALTGRAPARTSSRAPLPLIVPDIPLEVVRLLEAGLSEDPRERPTAEQFAVACYRWSEPEPVDLYPAATREVARELPTRRPPPVGDRRNRRHLPRLRLPRMPRMQWMPRMSRMPRLRSVVLAGVLALAIAGAVSLWLFGRGTPIPVSEPAPSASAPSVSTPSSSVSTSSSSGSAESLPGPGLSSPKSTKEPEDETPVVEDPVVEAVKTLGPARAHALTTVDRQRLGEYTVPNSPAFADDLVLLEKLESSGLHYEALEFRTAVVGDVEHSGPATATVPVELTISPYRTVSEDEGTVGETTSPTVERLTLEMRRGEDGWRVHTIVAAAPASTAEAGSEDQE